MSAYFDKQFISQHLEFRLEQFTWSREYLGNFRCPLCGDSQKRLNLKRAFFYYCNDTDSLRFKCHNCQEGSGWGLGPWLSLYDSSLQREYNFLKFKEEGKERSDQGAYKLPSEEVVKKPKRQPEQVASLFDEPDKGLPLEILQHSTLISQLEVDHPARLYVEGRKIPKKALERLLYVDNFKEFALAMQPDDLTVLKNAPEDKRLIIPFMSSDGQKLLCFQGRALEPDAYVRYFTVKMNENYDKIFGLDKLDMKRKKIVVEGPIDSLFIPNCVATADSNLMKFDGDIYIPDNQYRNRDLQPVIEGIIDSGKTVCLFPKEYEAYKDINDFIQKGAMNRKQLMELITSNLFKGLKAKHRWNVLKG